MDMPDRHRINSILAVTYYFFFILNSLVTFDTAQCFVLTGRSKKIRVKHDDHIIVRLSSFSKAVENTIIDKFGYESTERVRKSWDLLNEDYEHSEYLGDKDDNDSSGKTSNFRQECHSYVPGLTARTFWNASEYEWCRKLESMYPTIREEFLNVINNNNSNDKLQTEGNNVWAPMVDESAMAYGSDWKTLVLMDRGIWDRTNCNFFPKTAKAIHDCDVPTTEIFFASMQPKSTIKMHSDMVNFVLTSHLPLVIPQNGMNKCRLTVGDDTKEWLNGKVMLFDTSIMHDAINDTDEMRYILMLRVWHPELTNVERDALRHTFDCLAHPDLTSTHPDRKFMAEQEVQAWHAFPDDIFRNKAATTTVKNNKTSSKLKKNKKRAKAANNNAGKGFGSKK